MKKLIGMLLGVIAALPSHAAAQDPVAMIAYESCSPVWWYDEWQQWWTSTTISCSIGLVSLDRSKSAGVADGVDPAWSPDGSRVAFVGYSQPGIFVLNLRDWSVTKVFDFGDSPAWSPDGTKIAFSAGGLYVMAANGSSVVEVTNTVGYTGQPAWSPDSRRIAYDCQVEAGNPDICVIDTDGGGFLRLTSDPAWDSGAAFSPDGFTIAFATGRYGNSPEIAVMNSDGTGIRQVGTGTVGVRPAWSPDGTRMTFAVPYLGEGFACNADGSPCSAPDSYLDVINMDGTERWTIAVGDHPAWGVSVGPVAGFVPQRCYRLTCTFDGSGSWGGAGGIVSYTWNFGDGMSDSGLTVTHTYITNGTYTVTLTVTDSTGVTGTRTHVVDVVGNVSPIASFWSECSGRQCTFRGGGSVDPDGSIVNYFWSFGDGEIADSGSGQGVSHTYSADGMFTATLTVTDDSGAMDTQQQVVNIVNVPPFPSFMPTCLELTCTFDGSGSSDPDGTIEIYSWVFGDGTTGSGAIATHAYATGGTYTVTLTVRDNSSAASSQSKTVTAIGRMHVGDLDLAGASHQTDWTAFVTITVHQSSHAPLASATVSGSWSNGLAGSCTTNGGQCTLSNAAIPRKVGSITFTVVDVRHPFATYQSASNHDPDGDSDGTTVRVNKP